MAGAGQNLRPLDIGFVSRLVAVTGRANLNVRPRSENHFWMNTLQDLMEKHTYAEIAEIIAKEYADGKWNDETAPTTSELIRGVFAGYDRTKAASSSLGLAQGGPASAAGPSRQEPEPRQRDEATPAPRTGAAASSFTQRTPARTPAPRGAAATIAATQRAPVRAVDRIRRGTDSMVRNLARYLSITRNERVDISYLHQNRRHKPRPRLPQVQVVPLGHRLAHKLRVQLLGDQKLLILPHFHQHQGAGRALARITTWIFTPRSCHHQKSNKACALP